MQKNIRHLQQERKIFFCSVETGMNLWESLPNHENRDYTMELRLRASPRHGGQGFFWIVCY